MSLEASDYLLKHAKTAIDNVRDSAELSKFDKYLVLKDLEDHLHIQQRHITNSFGNLIGE